MFPLLSRLGVCMKEKFYKCAFMHCAYEDGKVSEKDAVKINGRYWHKDCYETKSLIDDIIEMYCTHISSTVPMGYLRKIVNDIVFGKKLHNPNVTKSQSNVEAARFLYFALNYNIENGSRLRHPPGLYYIIDSAKIKDAYKKQLDLQSEKEMKDYIEGENVEVGVPTNLQSSRPPKNNNMGFGNILKGGS